MLAQRKNGGTSQGQLVCVNPARPSLKKSVTDLDVMFNLTLQTDQESCFSEKPLDRITDTYSDDYNILEVDREIRKKFRYDAKYTVREYEMRLSREKSLLHPHQTMNERNPITKQIQKFTQLIERITSGQLEREYDEQTREYLDIYRLMGPKRKFKSFRSARADDSTALMTKPDDVARLNVISSYLEIAQNYIKLDITRKVDYNHLCIRCNYDMKNTLVDEESGIQECPRCHTEKFHIVRTNITSDSNKNVIYKNNNYDDRDNFIKALQRDQGRQPNRPPDVLYKCLDKHFEDYNLTPASKIREMPLTAKGTRGHSTKEMMMKALDETGNSGYYDDINLICNVYWNHSLPDYSHIEELIISDYDKLQPIYNSLPKKRTSNMNIDFRKFKQLELRGYPCRAEDHKMIKTRDILEEYEELWRLMIEKANELYPEDGFVFYRTI